MSLDDGPRLTLATERARLQHELATTSSAIHTRAAAADIAGIIDFLSNMAADDRPRALNAPLDKIWFTPLCCALLLGHSKCAEELIRIGADPRFTDADSSLIEYLFLLNAHQAVSLLRPYVGTQFDNVFRAYLNMQLEDWPLDDISYIATALIAHDPAASIDPLLSKAALSIFDHPERLSEYAKHFGRNSRSSSQALQLVFRLAMELDAVQTPARLASVTIILNKFVVRFPKSAGSFLPQYASAPTLWPIEEIARAWPLGSIDAVSLLTQEAIVVRNPKLARLLASHGASVPNEFLVQSLANGHWDRLALALVGLRAPIRFIPASLISRPSAKLLSCLRAATTPRYQELFLLDILDAGVINPVSHHVDNYSQFANVYTTLFATNNLPKFYGSSSEVAFQKALLKLGEDYIARAIDFRSEGPLNAKLFSRLSAALLEVITTMTRCLARRENWNGLLDLVTRLLKHVPLVDESFVNTEVMAAHAKVGNMAAARKFAGLLPNGPLEAQSAFPDVRRIWKELRRASQTDSAKAEGGGTKTPSKLQKAKPERISTPNPLTDPSEANPLLVAMSAESKKERKPDPGVTGAAHVSASSSSEVAPVGKENFQSDQSPGVGECPICMESHRDHVLTCGHAFCGECATRMSDCAVCRAPVLMRIKLFL